MGLTFQAICLVGYAKLRFSSLGNEAAAVPFSFSIVHEKLVQV